MSDVAGEAKDSSAAAKDGSAVTEKAVEVQRETSKEEPSSPNKSSAKAPGKAAGKIMEGKRAKKTVERLDFQAPKQMEKLKIGDGSGDKLGDIPRTGYQITKMKPADLKPLHAILFDRPGKMASLKKNLRLFNGFPFDADSEQYAKKREKLLKNSNFTNTKLKVVCGVLDLEKKGTHSDLVDRILSFLSAPKNSGKRLPVKKKRKSKKKLSGDDSSAKKKRKPKPRSSSSSPKKTKTGSKSKAIVMDSSSDEEDEEEDEKAGASAEAEGSDAEDKPSEKGKDLSDKSEESADEEEDDEAESPKSKAGRGKSASKKSAPVKRARTPAKKKGPPKKRARKDVSAESESDADSEAEEKPKKKKSAKPAAKTKKADSSSNRKHNTNTAEDSSDDDEPLIKMIKKAPSDAQLKETVRGLLKEANLEEMTMKQICQRVFDTYPDHDLAAKKDFIKQTVKSLIT